LPNKQRRKISWALKDEVISLMGLIFHLILYRPDLEFMLFGAKAEITGLYLMSEKLLM
jgi:hypothetical protein